MTEAAHQDHPPDAGEVASPSVNENVRQAGGEPANGGAKQNPNSRKTKASVRYLSEFIGEVPETRRVRFITNLKTAIRESQFDGGPISEIFVLSYSGRGSNGPEKRKTDQRDFVVEQTPAFEAWLANEAQATNTRQKYPSRMQLEGGEVNLAELADKFRRRGGSSTRRKAKR